jgi:hypothetical protein
MQEGKARASQDVSWLLKLKIHLFLRIFICCSGEKGEEEQKADHFKPESEMKTGGIDHKKWLELSNKID